MIFALDIRNGCCWKARPDQIATERDFYLLDAPAFEPDFLEKSLAEIESGQAPVVQKIRETRRLPTDDDEVDCLLNFIAITAARVPKIRRILVRPLIESARGFLRMSLESRGQFADTSKPSDRVTQADYEELRACVEAGDYELDFDPVTHFKGFHYATGLFLKWVAKQAWTLMIAAEDAPDFVFTDCPVIFLHDRETWKGLGAQPELMPTDTIMPLSRRLLLSGMTGRWAILPPTPASAELVGCFNALGVHWAERYIFSSDGQINLGRGSSFKCDQPLR